MSKPFKTLAAFLNLNGPEGISAKAEEGYILMYIQCINKPCGLLFYPSE
jgi:hypothetical protein